MRLHGDVRVQVVEGTICLLAAVPAALVHALNLLIATTGPLVLLCTRDGNEGVDLSITNNQRLKEKNNHNSNPLFLTISGWATLFPVEPRGVQDNGKKMRSPRKHARIIKNIPDQGAALRLQQGRRNQP